LQDDIERGAAWRQGEITDKQATVEARLADLHQCESTLGANRAETTDREGRQLPTFARASHNVAATTVLLDALPVSSTDRVGEVYQ
jgi:hypothetical protein